MPFRTSADDGTAPNVPPPIFATPGDFYTIVGSGTAPAGLTPVSDNIVTGQANWTQALRRNASRADLHARYTHVVYCVAFGLGLSAGTGLNANVAAGHAVIDGVVEIAATTVPLTASASNFLYLLRTGVISNIPSPTNASPTAPPDPHSVFIGRVVTSASAVTSTDTNGVFYRTGNQIYRTTLDGGMPADNPGAGFTFIAITSFGRYLWDGAGYRPLGVPAVTSDPASPGNGDVWYRTDLNQYCVVSGGVTYRSNSAVSAVPVKDNILSTDTVSVSAGFQQVYIERLICQGTLSVAGKIRIY